ncbi:hypothetical protein PQX77_008981 [Marasmius sp. AFHP31]|nr:hypothetical protein PQX77_008981 [Marasmius sp. AFHP31]
MGWNLLSLSLSLALFVIAGYLVGIVIAIAIRPWRSNIGHIPGPCTISSSWLYGNMADLMFTENYGDNEFQWQKMYGMTYRIKGCMGEDRLFSSDPLVFKAIFNNKIFDKHQWHLNTAGMLFGENSLFAVRHGTHSQLRSVFNPAFSPGKIEQLVQVFQEIAHKASARLADECSSGPLRDVYEILQNAATDAVGEGNAMSSAKTKSSLVADDVLVLFPVFLFQLAAKYLSTSDMLSLRRYKKVMDQWSESLLNQKRENLQLGIEDNDLLSIVVEINEKAGDHPSRLTRQQIKDQIPSILVAGQDTTGNTTAFALYEFAKRPEWQERVRNELLSVNGERRTAAAYDRLQLLNAHIKETSRLHSALPHTFREALEDTIIPLSEPITTVDGRQISVIPVKKGQVVYAGIASYHRNIDIWGEDAEIFDPLRWVDGRTDNIKGPTVGPYANLATFIGGPNVCLGWRFAILESQVILAELLSKFRFELDDSVVIRSSVAITLQPVSEKGVPHLPLRVTPLEG